MILNLIKILFYATGTIVNIVKLAKLIKKTNTSKIGEHKNIIGAIIN